MSISAQAATSSSGLAPEPRPTGSGFGIAEDVVTCGLEAPYGVFAATGKEAVGAFAGLAKPDMAQDRGRSRIVGDHTGLETIEVEVGQPPARQATGCFGGDAVAPETPPDPVAEPTASGGAVDAETDDTHHDLVLALAAGDGELVGTTLRQGLPRGEDPLIGQFPWVGERHDGKVPCHLPVVDQAMQ